MIQYPREYLWFVERVLRRHPDRLRELREKEETIIACCHMPVEVHGGGSTSSEQERILEAEERDKTYQRLLEITSKVNAALQTLTPEEYEVIQLMLWEDMWKSQVADIMAIDEANVWRLKHKALKKVAKFVIGNW